MTQPTTQRIVEQKRKNAAIRLARMRGLVIHDELSCNGGEGVAAVMAGRWGYPVSVDGDPRLAFCPQCYSHYSDFEKTSVVPCWNCRYYAREAIKLDDIDELVTQNEHDWRRESGGVLAVRAIMDSERCRKHLRATREDGLLNLRTCLVENQRLSRDRVNFYRNSMSGKTVNWLKTSEKGKRLRMLYRSAVDREKDCVESIRDIDSILGSDRNQYNNLISLYDERIKQAALIAVRAKNARYSERDTDND